MGPTELLIVLAIVVLLFGATRLPALGKALGDTMKAFRDSSKGDSGKDKIESDKKDVVRIEDAQVERDEPKKLEDKGSDKA
ncbi:MAG: twin-arginine translocase TatA/TatE family subunit [Myxococcales bacterium]|nr:twin-arginine translocase TatA/TatE family subunit [Myxococcales bacterium]